MFLQRCRKVSIWIALLVLGTIMSGSGTGSALAMIPTAGSAAVSSGSLPGGVTAAAKGVDHSLDNFDCSTVSKLGIDKMMNLRASAIMVHCGLRPGGTSAVGNAGNGRSSAVPSVYGGADADVILPDGTSPHVTQSESFVWGNGTTIVVNYNDSRTAPGCYSGISYSTDSGATWHASQALCTSAHGTNEGDPIVVYNARLATWFAGDLAVGGDCGAGSTGGIGLWTSPNGITWTAGGCAHGGTQDDRQSMWVDNNPASLFYGRMYVSWNNFAIGGGQLFVTFSDNGTVWSTPTRIGPTSPFVRNGQVTGSPNGDGTVFVSGHTESTTDTTYMFRSTDGGVNWLQFTVNTYTPAGSSTVAGCSFRAIAPIWRAPEWGQPAVSGQIAGQNVVHYVYAAQGAGGDLGDAMYVRSTDNGATWSVPLKLNTDITTQPQWQPSISAAPNGGVMASWYDRRNTTDGSNYEYYGRLSTDNGATWQTDQAVSDGLIDQPVQADPNVQTCYAGDYNYHSAFGTTAFLTWDDGRNLVVGTHTQDVDFDKVSLVVGTPTPTATGTPPTNTPTQTRTSTVTPTRTPCGLLTPLNEGFESGTLGAFTSAVATCVPGGCGWSAVTTAAHTGTFSAFSPDVANISDQLLVTTNPVAIPAGGLDGATLSFWHRYTFEGSGANYFDGGVLEASTNGGATWVDAGANILTGGYNGTISTAFSNPLAGRSAWGQASPGYPAFFQTTVNLLPYAGQNLLFRFRQGDDNSNSSSGWWVDDVLVTFATSCATPTIVPTNTPTRTPSNTPTRTPTAIFTATRTATPGTVVIIGHVTWQGIAQPDARNSGLAGQFSLCVSSSPITYPAGTDASGTFTVTTGLAPGSYNWRYKGPRNLSNGGTLVLSAGTNHVELGTLRAGDCNNSNIVDSSDFIILKTTFGLSQGQPGYDARADFNNDNTISAVDFSLMKGNFGLAGTALTCP